MDETEIVRRMQQGDEEAFDRIYELYKSRLFSMAYLISGNHADSEDIVQESFVKCYINRNRLKDTACFTRWLYQILTRTAWRYCSKKRREQPREEVYEADRQDDGVPLADQVVMRDEQQRLYAAIGRLEVRQRTAVVLYYFNQLSTREIARVMGCMEGTVKSRLHAARSNLQKVLGETEWEGKEAFAWKKKSLTF